MSFRGNIEERDREKIYWHQYEKETIQMEDICRRQKENWSQAIQIMFFHSVTKNNLGTWRDMNVICVNLKQEVLKILKLTSTHVKSFSAINVNKDSKYKPI